MKRKFLQKLCAAGVVVSLLMGFTACAGRKPSSEKSAAAEQSDMEQTAAEAQAETAAPTGTAYDRTAQNGAAVLNDGDSLTGGTYTATGADESVLEASGTVKASVTGASLKKTGGDATGAENASFTGVNAAVRVYGNAEVLLADCEIEATAENATGVFAYENGVIRISDCAVNVTGGGAGGVQVAGGGTLIGENLTVTSAGKAAIRSDRGGGTLTLTGGSYTSTGSNGCPAIYSTADITVSDALCVSEKSRAVIIEGKNTVTLHNCTLTGNDQSTKEGSVKANVLLYQSASGDAADGTSVFTMEGGEMTAQSGAMFYCTNTRSVINLKNAALTLSEAGTLLTVSAGRWGRDGKNGGVCTLNAEEQTLNGNMETDAVSSLQINLTDSDYTGCITGEGSVEVTMDENSTWTLTGDSYVTGFSGSASGVISNGYTLYVDGAALTGTN